MAVLVARRGRDKLGMRVGHDVWNLAKGPGSLVLQYSDGVFYRRGGTVPYTDLYCKELGSFATLDEAVRAFEADTGEEVSEWL